jgi:hypothetical protein
LQSETFQPGRDRLVREPSDVPLTGAGPDVLAWRDAADRLAVVNFGAAPAYLRPAPALPREAELVASTDPSRLPGDVALERFILLPREAVLLRLPIR